MTTFDEHALASLPEAAGFTGDLRRQAFADFEALPIPSQETEEWRYTDLSELELTFAPYTAGGRTENLDGVPGEVLEAAGDIGERAGLQIQHDSDVMVTHLDPGLVAKGVDLLRPRRGRGVASRAGRAIPPRPRADASARGSRRCTRRSAPGARSCTCRATRRWTCRCRR